MNPLNNKSKNIDTLVSLISKIKENEINFYEKKIIYLKHQMHIHPNNKVYVSSYKLTKIRFENLIETSRKLKHLELDININNKNK